MRALCGACGSLVGDVTRHIAWHRSLGDAARDGVVLDVPVFRTRDTEESGDIIGRARIIGICGQLAPERERTR